MTDLAKLRAELRAGLNDVTPGPWQASPQKGRPRHGVQAQVFRYHADDDTSILAVDMTETEAEATATAAHIARCSPENIRALLDALDAAERERDEAKRIIAECINQGTDGNASAGCSMDFLSHAPTECAAIKRQRDEARDALATARRDALEEAAARSAHEINFCREDAPIDLRSVRARVEAAIRALKDRTP